ACASSWMRTWLKSKWKRGSMNARCRASRAAPGFASHPHLPAQPHFGLATSALRARVPLLRSDQASCRPINPDHTYQARGSGDGVVCRQPASRKCDAYPGVVVLIAGPGRSPAALFVAGLVTTDALVQPLADRHVEPAVV